MKKTASKKVSKGELSVEISQPIQITNIQEPTEDEIKEASIKLSELVEIALIIVNKKRAIKKGRRFRDKTQQAEIEAIDQKVEDETREDSLKVVSVLMKYLHEFANVSDIYTLDIHPHSLKNQSLLSIRQPLRLIGTSAHHAAVLFLQQCLAHDFLNQYPDVMENWGVIQNRIDPQLFLARIDWERMRCFNMTITHKTAPDLWITGYQIREEITRAKLGKDIKDKIDKRDLFTRSGLRKRINKCKSELPPDAKGDNNISVWKLKTIKPHLEKIAHEVPPERWAKIAITSTDALNPR